MRAMIPALWLLATSTVVNAQAAVRARSAELEAARARGIPNLDGSDGAVVIAARHFCGSTRECITEFLTARDQLYNLYFDAGRRKDVVRAVAATRDETNIDWRAAANRAMPGPVAPNLSTYTARLDCRDWTDSAGSHSECTLTPSTVPVPYIYRRRY